MCRYPERETCNRETNGRCAGCDEGHKKDMTVAKTILEQLGSMRFVAMTGAKNLGATKTSLTFKVGKNDHKITHVKIELDGGLDLYTMTTFKIKGGRATEIDQVEMLYASDLRRVFTEKTGLDTSL
jgi:hypothetical protein